MPLCPNRWLRRGWWVEENATVYCFLPADGLVVYFNLEDIQELMDREYPHDGEGDNKRWYFNSSKDREIAEQSDDWIIANPQILWRHYLRGGC